MLKNDVIINASNEDKHGCNPSDQYRAEPNMLNPMNEYVYDPNGR